MTRKVSYFLGAATLASYFLLRGGAPPLAVALGITCAGIAMWWRSRTA